MSIRTTIPKLPPFLERKIYKTGQTRGADDDSILQNRVARNSTALFPYSIWDPASCTPPDGSYERGYIVLIKPRDWHTISTGGAQIKDPNLQLGDNLLVFYETRADWTDFPLPRSWNPANNRYGGELNPSPKLGGQYVARVPSLTSATASRLAHGFADSSNKGAGIQGFEYASAKRLEMCRSQLEFLYWCCADAEQVSAHHGMTSIAVAQRKRHAIAAAKANGLDDFQRLRAIRAVDRNGETVCPLCLKKLSAAGFLSRLAQGEGRETPDLTVTEINLFHIEELRYGAFNHKPYNLGWGCHHCNATARDMGITNTIAWMREVLDRNSS
jgi:hypothetical protein